MNNILLDNSPGRKMADALKSCIADPKCHEIMIATGFWDLPGTMLVADELEEFLSREGVSLRLLIGTDPVVRSKYLEGKFPDDAIKQDIFKLQFNEQYQPLISLLFKYCCPKEEDSKIKIRIYKRDHDGNAQFLHAKCFIFVCPPPYGSQSFTVGIIGSSNFTQKGLEDNSELNYVETSPISVLSDMPQYHLFGHKPWFEAKWEEAEDWNHTFIAEILPQAPVAKDNPDNPINRQPEPLTPYELYIKYLQTQFGDMLNADTTAVLRSYLPANYEQFDYQLDAVKQGLSIMKQYKGFILGDVVGLGKTVVGMVLIRHFLENAAQLGRPRRVLVVTPPSIKPGWLKTIADFDRNQVEKVAPMIQFITTGSISGMVNDMDDQDEDGDAFVDNLANEPYGLIVVDESHNFRNSGTQKYAALDALIGTANPQPYVCLMSATPQNNSPRDIYNQIRLFQRDANNTDLPGIPGGKLDKFFRDAMDQFNRARNMPQEQEWEQRTARDIIADVSTLVRRHVLDQLVVRRTRTDIRKHYQTDLQALRFPTVRGPHKLEYRMDPEMQRLFFDTVNAISPATEDIPESQHIQFHRYAAISYFADPHTASQYETRNLTVAGITARLQKIMRIMLVKRLESSMAAFRTSLTNLLRYTEVMVDMLAHDRVYVCPDIDVNQVYRDSDGDFTAFCAVMNHKMAQQGGNNLVYRTADFKKEYVDHLQQDRHLISKLLERWSLTDFDPKFERFKDAIRTELFDPSINNPSGSNTPRLVIFTEAVDTLKTIKRWLESQGFKVLGVTAANRTAMQPDITANFDANLPQEQQRDDYNVIVTTEVLAEGVNLHRANVILNYDAPWNATRLMQRIGRINRIGSQEAEVHVFNFFPSTEGNEQIRLVEKAYAKLQSFHEMFGEDNKVFSEREELPEHELQQIADGEESPMEPFFAELKEYQKSHPDRYNWLQKLELDALGGEMPHDDDSTREALMIFRDQTSAMVSVSLTDRQEDQPRVIAPLETMRWLRCPTDDRFTGEALPQDSPLLIRAKATFNIHVDKVLRRSDSNAQIVAAQQFISDLRNLPGITVESKSILKNLQRLVRNKNTFVIKMLIKQKKLRDKGRLSLFGDNFEINSWLQTSFAHLAATPTRRRGEGQLAIYEIR